MLSMLRFPPLPKSLHSKPKPPTRHRDLLDHVGNLITFFTFLAALAAAIFTGRQVAILGQQLTVARDTEQRQLRAYVFPDHAVISNADDDVSTQPVTIFMMFKNSGITPAYKVTNIGAAILLPFPFHVDIRNVNIPEFKIKTASSSYLAAGAPYQTASVYVDGAIEPLNADQKESLRNGSTAIYFFGEITYYDTFDILRCTRYEYYVGGDFGFHGSDMVNAPEGQEADLDCQPPKANPVLDLPQVPHYE
jgi:hypothetical protein